MKNINDEEIVKLYDGKYEEGKRTLEWDGLDNNNQPIENGYYILEAESGIYCKTALFVNK